MVMHGVKNKIKRRLEYIEDLRNSILGDAANLKWEVSIRFRSGQTRVIPHVFSMGHEFACCIIWHFLKTDQEGHISLEEVRGFFVPWDQIEHMEARALLGYHSRGILKTFLYTADKHREESLKDIVCPICDHRAQNVHVYALHLLEAHKDLLSDTEIAHWEGVLKDREKK